MRNGCGYAWKHYMSGSGGGPARHCLTDHVGVACCWTGRVREGSRVSCAACVDCWAETWCCWGHSAVMALDCRGSEGAGGKQVLRFGR